jgi:hypothetical protein
MSAWKYREVADANGDDWSCISPYVEVGPHGPGLRSNMAVYITGVEHQPRHATLTLNVNFPGGKWEALREFAEVASALTKAALGPDLSERAKGGLSTGSEGRWTIDGKNVAAAREPFDAGGTPGGFTMRFMITL